MFCKLAEVFNTRIIVRKWGLYYGKNEMENGEFECLPWSGGTEWKSALERGKILLRSMIKS